MILRIFSNWCVLHLPARKAQVVALEQAFTCLQEFTFNCRVMGRTMLKEPLGMGVGEQNSNCKNFSVLLTHRSMWVPTG